VFATAGVNTRPRVTRKMLSAEHSAISPAALSRSASPRARSETFATTRKRHVVDVLGGTARSLAAPAPAAEDPPQAPQQPVPLTHRR